MILNGKHKILTDPAPITAQLRCTRMGRHGNNLWTLVWVNGLPKSKVGGLWALDDQSPNQRQKWAVARACNNPTQLRRALLHWQWPVPAGALLRMQPAGTAVLGCCTVDWSEKDDRAPDCLEADDACFCRRACKRSHAAGRTGAVPIGKVCTLLHACPYEPRNRLLSLESRGSYRSHALGSQLPARGFST
jgi:hypothetical protein